MTAAQITRRAIATLCDADFNTIYDYTRDGVMAEDLISMNEQCEGED